MRLKFDLAGMSRDLTFPDRGLVLLTGPVGAGKTLIHDAVFWALFGRSLRGRMPEGNVRLEMGDLVVTRERKGGRLTFECADSAHPTTRKAQAALDARIGNVDTWLHTALCSSEDARQFIRAADKERKALIEELLPAFAQFDPALDRCRAELRQAEADHFAASRAAGERATEVRVLQAGLVHLEHAAQIDVGQAPVAEDFGAQRAVWEGEKVRLKQLIERLERDSGAALIQSQNDLQALRVELAGVTHAHEEAKFKLTAANKQLDVLSAKMCPICAQPIPAEKVAAASAWAEESKTAAAAMAERRAEEDAAFKTRWESLQAVYGAQHDALIARMRAARSALSEAEDALRDVKERESRWLDQRRRYDAQLAAKQQADALLARDRERLVAAEQHLAATQKRVAECELDVQRLRASEQVLGLRGARVQLIERTIRALEACANTYMATLWPDVRLQIRSVKEVKGGTRDEVSLTLTGHSTEEVRQVSKGEGRRIDYALFFARRDMLRAAGAVPPFSFHDEMLDGFEDPTQVGALLTRIAQDELVVVISHKQAVWDGLRWDQRIAL